MIRGRAERAGVAALSAADAGPPVTAPPTAPGARAGCGGRGLYSARLGRGQRKGAATEGSQGALGCGAARLRGSGTAGLRGSGAAAGVPAPTTQ